MNVHDELDRTRKAVRDLEIAVEGLRQRLGQHLDVLRLADDVARCAADLSRLEQQSGSPRRIHVQDLVVIPDDDYDHSLLAAHDVDTEGLGAPGRRAP